MVHIREIHERDAALIPCLYFEVAARDRNEGSIVGHTILAVALRGGHLVVARKFQFVVLQMEECVSAPLVRIVRAAAGSESATPLIGEHNFLPIIRKRSGVPVRVIRIVYSVEALWINWIFDVQQDSVTVACACCESKLRIDGNVVTLITGPRFCCVILAVTATTAETVQHAASRIHK